MAVRDALAWLALRVGYAVLGGCTGCMLAGSLALAWYCVPKPRVVRWRA